MRIRLTCLAAAGLVASGCTLFKWHALGIIRPPDSARRLVIPVLRIGALLVVLAVPAWARSLEELQKGFMESYDALNLERDERLRTLSAGYLEVLGGLMEKARGAGNLEAALPIRDEMDAVRDGRWPLKELPAIRSEALRENRGKYLDARRRIVADHAGELVKLAGAMEELLEKEEVALTRAGKLDRAVSVKRMREVLVADAGVQRARDLVGSVDDGPQDSIGVIPAEIKKQAFTVMKTTYYLFPDPMTHAEAATACKELGGTILKIRSKGEYDHFHRYSVENGKPLWIDLQDEEKDGDWRHTDGSKARFLKWQSGEPNGGDAQKHVMIGFRGGWDMRDVNADDRFHVICDW